DAGVTVWQMLPIGPTHGDLSPYQSLSAHAGHPDLISLDWLVQRGWLSSDNTGVTSGDQNLRKQARACAADNFFLLINSGESSNESLKKSYSGFCEENKNWLDEFSLFKTLRQHHDNKI